MPLTHHRVAPYKIPSKVEREQRMLKRLGREEIDVEDSVLLNRLAELNLGGCPALSKRMRDLKRDNAALSEQVGALTSENAALSLNAQILSMAVTELQNQVGDLSLQLAKAYVLLEQVSPEGRLRPQI